MTTRKIGRYEVRRELGRGGMGTVYVAYDPRLEREVAIKVLPTYFAEDPDSMARFDREAKTIAKLAHYAIVPVHDYGADGMWPYFVMRLLAGGSLKERIAVGPMSLAECNTVITRVASALDKAHSRGIIHRDVKPSNILFDEDENAYLGDFGLVRLAEASENFTLTGEILGTPAYMSPEQVDQLPDIDGRTDIYSLGIVLYEMLSGETPYTHDSSARLMMMHVTEPVPDIMLARSDLPPGIQEVINTAMAKRRDDRYATAGALALAVEALADQQEQDVGQETSMAPETLVLAGTDREQETVVDTPTPAVLPAAAVQEPTVAITTPPQRPSGEDQSSTAEPAPKSPTRPRWLLLAAGLLVVALAVAGIVFLVSQGSSTSDAEELSKTLTRIVDQGEVAIGVSEGNWLPFSIDLGGRYDGFEINLIQAVIDRMTGKKVDIKYVPATAESRFPLLQGGDVDVLIRRTTNTLSRQEEWGFLFTGNYFLDGQRLMVRADSGIRDWNGLNGRAVCVAGGSVNEQYVLDLARSPDLDFDIIAADNWEDSWSNFVAGRCDGITADWSYLLTIAGQTDDPDRFAIVGDAISQEPLAIVVRNEDPAFRNEIDKALTEVIEDGTWQRLYQQWIDADPYWTFEEMRAVPAVNR